MSWMLYIFLSSCLPKHLHVELIWFSESNYYHAIKGHQTKRSTSGIYPWTNPFQDVQHPRISRKQITGETLVFTHRLEFVLNCIALHGNAVEEHSTTVQINYESTKTRMYYYYYFLCNELSIEGRKPDVGISGLGARVVCCVRPLRCCGRLPYLIYSQCNACHVVLGYADLCYVYHEFETYNYQ